MKKLIKCGVMVGFWILGIPLYAADLQCDGVYTTGYSSCEEWADHKGEQDTHEKKVVAAQKVAKKEQEKQAVSLKTFLSKLSKECLCKSKISAFDWDPDEFNGSLNLVIPIDCEFDSMQIFGAIMYDLKVLKKQLKVEQIGDIAFKGMNCLKDSVHCSRTFPVVTIQTINIDGSGKTFYSFSVPLYDQYLNGEISWEHFGKSFTVLRI